MESTDDIWVISFVIIKDNLRSGRNTIQFLQLRVEFATMGHSAIAFPLRYAKVVRFI